MRWLNGILFCVLAILLSTIAAAMYGLLHDLITFTISEEYYTHFKFIQFELDEPIIEPNGETSVHLFNPILGAALVGVMATWWLGPPLGFILGICILGWIKKGERWTFFAKAIWKLLCIAFCAGTIGAMIGYLTADVAHVNAVAPFGIKNPHAFYVVGCIHNFSYLGALVGLFYALVYIRKSSKRMKSL